MSAKHTRGIFPVAALLFSATLWGIIWYPLRLLEQQGLDGLWATGIIYLSALLAGVVLMTLIFVFLLLVRLRIEASGWLMYTILTSFRWNCLNSRLVLDGSPRMS